MRALSATFPIFVLLAACSGNKEELDVDGDGVESPADCDDTNPDIKPGALEVCDGVDNDCDGEVDEGAGSAYYVDSDNDGYGDALVPKVALCELVAGYTEQAGDCDDTDAAVNPDAQETCDDVDRNCDGSPTFGAVDVTSWYIDRDGDGYGWGPEFGGLDPVEACTAPGADYVDNGDDCNDSEPTANPLGSEVCNDIDDDCNGYVDDNPSDGEVLYTDADGDFFGDAGAAVNGCPGIGLVADATDCDDTNDEIYPGAEEVCNGGVDDDCDPSTDEDLVDGIIWYTDNDSDGYGDVEVTACLQPSNAVNRDGDCNDADDTIHPNAPEDCTAVDRDCDGDLVAGAADAEVYFLDADRDGFGRTSSSQASCTPLSGYSLVPGDCNDASDVIFPGAPELCNGGVDDDCNTLTDDDDSPDAISWYFDSDGDGYAGSVIVVVACEQPQDGYNTADDCDDTVATTYPGANDICDGGIDNDCDPLTDEEVVNVLYEDADFDGYGNNSVFELGCFPTGALTNAIPTGDDCDDTDPLINPYTTPDCTQDHCGTLATSETWRASITHVISCDVKVEGANSPELTIAPGAVVRFDAGTELRVGDTASGSIHIDASTPVTFTSSEPIPANGDYDGLYIGDNQDGSYIRGLIVEYAGGSANESAGIRLDLGDTLMELESVTATRNAGDGIRVITGKPLIHDSTLIDNDGNGLYVKASQGLSRLDQFGSDGPSLTGMVVTGNGDRAITVPGSHADEIGPSAPPPFGGDNLFLDPANPNGEDTIELLTGTMRTTGNWRNHAMPYYVAKNAVVTVEDGPEAILTVDDGITVYFDEGAELVIGNAAQGALYVGNYPNPSAPGDEVMFLADPALSANNLNWDGVKIGANGSDSEIAGLIVEEGGGNGKGNLWINASAPSIAYSVFQYSDNAGIYVDGTGAAPRITSTDMNYNDTYGLFVASTSGIYREIGSASFIDNSFVGNGTTSVALPPNYVGQLDESSTFADPNPTKRIRIHGGDVTDDALWQKLDADYEVLGSVYVEGPRDPVLEIAPQSVLYMARNSRFSMGADEDGALIIDAGSNPSDRVVFTSADPAPGPGDWVGMVIGENGPLRDQTTITGMDIEYAGSLGSLDSGAIRVQARDGGCPSYYTPQRNVALSYVSVLESGNIGLFMDEGSQASLDHVSVPLPLDGYCIGQDMRVPTCPAPLITAASDLSCAGVDLGYLNAASLAAIPPNVDFGLIALDGGTYASDVTIPALLTPILVSETIAVRGVTNPTLTIEDGTTLYFEADAGIEVGGFEPGELLVEGNGSQFLPADGNLWQGFTLSTSCYAEIQGGFVDGGGANGEAAIWVDGCDSGIIGDVTFANSYGTCDISIEYPYPAGFDISGAVSANICTP